MYSDQALLGLAHEHDPGFDRLAFARQLARITELDVRDTAAYGVDSATLSLIKQRLLSWAAELDAP